MNYDSPPPSPLNASTEPPEATQAEQLTCPNHARKRSRTMQLARPRKRLMLDKCRSEPQSDSDEESDATTTAMTSTGSTKRRKQLKAKRRRHLDSPPGSPCASPNNSSTPRHSPIRSEEAIKFECAITRGSWANVFYRFGAAIVANGGKMLDGVHLDLYDSKGMTALHAACTVGMPELVILLLKRNAKHQLATLSGWTVWHLAARDYRILHCMLDFLRPQMA